MNEAATLTASSAAALQSFFASGVVLLCVLLCGLAGLRAKLFRSILSFGSMMTAAVAAFVWCDGAGRLLAGFGMLDAWSLVAGYTTVLCLVMALMSALFRLMVRAEVMTYAPVIDRLGGALVGVVAGVLLASVARVGFAMAPVSAAARPTPAQLQLDVTPRVLQMMGRILSSDASVRRAWLYGAGGRVEEGKPAPGQLAWSEPFIDLDSNGKRGADEPFLDKDGNGRFTEVFAAGDAATVRGMQVGAMDRYWLGNWRLVSVMESNPPVDAAKDAE